VSIAWTLDHSKTVLIVIHSRRTTSQINLRGTTTHAARTTKFFRLTQSKIQLTPQHRSKITPKVVSFLSIADDMLQIKSVRAKAFEYNILSRSKISSRRLRITLSKSVEKAWRIEIGLYLVRSVRSAALKTKITLAILRNSRKTPEDKQRLIMVTRGWKCFEKTNELQGYINMAWHFVSKMPSHCCSIHQPLAVSAK